MDKSVLMILLLLVAVSCNSPEDQRLEEALVSAGTNRPELEKVLEHYQGDSLKLEAARFLIRNMPFHHYYEDARIDSAKAVLSTASLQGGYIPDGARKRKWQNFSYLSLPKKRDVEQMSAELLVEHIDWAFKAWEEAPWSDSYTFEDFCEWVLPYRTGNEPLESWRETYYKRYKPVLDSLYQGTDILVAADSLARYLKKERNFAPNTDFQLPHLGASYLFDNCLGSCRETTDFTVYVYRSLGFPIGIDNYYYSPSVHYGHLWNVLKNTDGRAMPFWYMDPNNLAVGVRDDRKKGKVYRVCYEAVEEKTKGIHQSGNTAPRLCNPLAKDVTEEYFGANRHEIDIDNGKDDWLVTLGVFSAFGYEAVGVAGVEDKSAVVLNVEPDVIFFPLRYKENGMEDAGYPFMIHDGKSRLFKADTEKRETHGLTRKYPVQSHIYKYMSWMTGGRLEVSNDRRFRIKETLYCIVDTPKVNVNLYYPSVTSSYRYVRFCPPDGWRPEVAELAFYAEKEDKEKIPAVVIDGCPSVNEEPQYTMDKAGDDDWLSFFWGADPNGTVTFDLGSPHRIGKVLFVPRNDDNFVKPGDVYELFYHAGVDGWKSLGRKTAGGYQLLYDNIPAGALLWLKNHTGGKEEQVFYMENGKQVFCYDLPLFQKD